MAKKNSNQPALLRLVGLWATIWWAVSCLYVLLVVWLAKNLYIDKSLSWGRALSHSFSVYKYLWLLLGTIMLGWVVLAVKWLKALDEAKISLKSGLKDLFFTLR